jgi:GNAT superfamily N-acetyltransferase
MLEYARDLALSRGCYKLSLTSNAVREEAHEFYRRCGMAQHGVSFRDAL